MTNLNVLQLTMSQSDKRNWA